MPVLVVNAEHDIACAKGVYWEEEGEGASGMFAETACDYFVLEDHTHSWFRGTDAKAPTNVAPEGGRTEGERAAAAGAPGRSLPGSVGWPPGEPSLLRKWQRRWRTAWLESGSSAMWSRIAATRCA